MRRYLTLWSAPGGPRLIAGGILLAPGQAAVDLVLLLALHRSTGSFGPGGVAVAVFTIVNSGANLAQSRLVDRVGALWPLAVCAVAMLAVAGATSAALAAGAAVWAVVVLAGVLGAFLPATGASLRALWSARLPDPDDRVTGFAFVSFSQEIGFIAGPAAFGALATLVSPTAGLLACGASVCAGTLIVASAGPTRGLSGDGEAGSGERPGLGSLAPVAAAIGWLGLGLGAFDVSVPAFAVQHGAASLGGVLLAIGSAGSLVGGAVYGARRWRAGVRARLAVCAAVSAVLLLGPAASQALGLMAAALFVACAPLSATLTTGYLFADERAPASRSTEAFALVGLALNAGVAIGNAVAGRLVSHGTANHGFLIVAAGVLACALTVIATSTATSLSRR
jgi:predicted MFS family arabinose efflux permease